MATITLTLPTAGTVITAGLHATNYTAIQSAINGGLDTANWASGKIFAPSKFLQEGAATGQAIVWNGSSWVPGTSVPAMGTSLPGSPGDGDEYVYIADAANGVLWHLKYKASLSKWCYIGGPPLYAEVVTSEATSSATYVALATAGPVVTLPALAGDWDIETGCSFGVGVTSRIGFMSYDIGGTGAVDADAVTQPSVMSANAGFIGQRLRRKTALSASIALTAKYRNDGATAVNYANRWMAVKPVKVI